MLHKFIKLDSFSPVRRRAERRCKLSLTQVGAHQGVTVHNLAAGLLIGADLDTARVFRPGPELQSSTIFLISTSLKGTAPYGSLLISEQLNF